MPYYVYILVSERDHTLYTGQTKDLRRRIQRHNKGLIKSTKGKVPYTLQYFEEFASRSAAMAREWELKKKWNTERKRKLIDGFDKRLLPGTEEGD